MSNRSGRFHFVPPDHQNLDDALACQEEALEAQRREIAACAFCELNRGRMAPPHFASPNCESGKRNHCTCDVCF